VVVNNEALEFFTAAVLWPSLTKAEMMVCLTALMVVPVIARVKIFTDSAATITSFNNLIDF